jgi:hypothetical protein
MREQMPVVAALIDEYRAVFGKESIDTVIRRGMKGEPVFFASENGHTVGTPIPRGVRVLKDERGNPCIVVDGDGNRFRHVDGEDRPELKGVN